jgi:putative chitinase
MFAFDRNRFFGDFTARTRLPLTPMRQAALEHLLDCFVGDASFTMLRQLAYVLATIRWETAHTFLPVEERRASPERQPALHRRQSQYWGFHGRGYVQLTWQANYLRAGRELAGREYDVGGRTVQVTPTLFVEEPALVKDPRISYDIAALGMRKGWFTGRKLGDYVREGAAPDYVNARRVINGLDCAQDIAALADQFELLLRGAAVEAPALRRARRQAGAKGVRRGAKRPPRRALATRVTVLPSKPKPRPSAKGAKRAGVRRKAAGRGVRRSAKGRGRVSG